MAGTKRKQGDHDRGADKKQKGVSKAVALAIRKVKTSEKKFFDVSITGGLCGTVAHVKQLLFSPVTGPDENARIGRTARIASILLSGTIGVSLATCVGQSTVQLMLLLDSQPNAATFVSTDCFTSDTLESNLNLDNRKRFKVLRKWEYLLAGLETSSGGPTYPSGLPAQVRFHEFVKYSTEVEFNGVNGGSIADITKNALFLVGCYSGNYPAFGTSFPVVYGTSRVRFTDN